MLLAKGSKCHSTFCWVCQNCTQKILCWAVWIFSQKIQAGISVMHDKLKFIRIFMLFKWCFLQTFMVMFLMLIIVIVLILITTGTWLFWFIQSHNWLCSSLHRMQSLCCLQMFVVWMATKQAAIMHAELFCTFFCSFHSTMAKVSNYMQETLQSLYKQDLHPAEIFLWI